MPIKFRSVWACATKIHIDIIFNILGELDQCNALPPKRGMDYFYRLPVLLVLNEALRIADDSALWEHLPTHVATTRRPSLIYALEVCDGMHAPFALPNSKPAAPL